MKIMRLITYGTFLVLLTVIVRELTATATNLFNTVDQAVSTGETFLKAMKLYNDLEDFYKAKVLIKIINYTGRTLAGGKHQVESGLNSQLPLMIHRGSMDAITVYQNKPYEGVDAAFSYTISESVRLFIYVKGKQKSVSRPENTLGICLARGDDVFDDQWYNDILSSLARNEKVASSPNTLQCCLDDLCVQASMTSSHQAEVNVHVIPRNRSEFWEPPADISQEDLDHVLSIPDTCFNDNDDDDDDDDSSTNLPFTYTHLYVIILLSILVLSVVVCVCCCRSRINNEPTAVVSHSDKISISRVAFNTQ